MFKLLALAPLLTFSLVAAVPASTGSGLSFTVPPPQCLNTCIHTLNACTLCMPDNKFSSCISSTCGPKDQSYASAYYSSICSDGGYISYDTTPAQNVYIATDAQSKCNSTQ